MNVETIRNYCLSKQSVSEGFPFDETTIVFKVKGKIFALMPLNSELRINLKCDPEWAIELREENEAIIPGFHMNKKHWNTIIIDDSISEKFLEQLISHSYDLVYASLPKSLRNNKS